MTTQQRTTILVASVTFCSIAALLIIHPWVKQAPTKQYQAGDTITYTDATTGQSVTDIPGESGGQLAGVIFAPGATIDGLENLRAYLTNDQFLNTSTVMSNFLLAHSGSSAVSAGIRHGTIEQSNSKLIFLLAADRPQATYHVAIDTSDSQGPSVTIERVE